MASVSETPAAAAAAAVSTETAAASEPGVRDMQLGKRALAQNKFEDALDHFSEALRLRVEKYGETGPETAQAYFLYGHALLSKVEKECDVFGGDVNPNASGADGAEEKENTGVPATATSAAEDDFEPPEGEEVDDDLESAFELLEVARVITSKPPQQHELLAKVHTRLGDLSVWQESFSTAVEEYKAALAIRQSQHEPTHTDIVATLVDIGMAYVWWMSASNKAAAAAAASGSDVGTAGSSTSKSEPSVAERKTQALHYYTQAHDLYTQRVNRYTTVPEGESEEDKIKRETLLNREKSTLDELSLKIDELKSTNAEGDPTLKRAAPATTPAAAASANNGTTTIGFGGQSKANEGVTTIGFGSAKPTTTSAPTNNLGVFGRKAKRPRVEPVAPVASDSTTTTTTTTTGTTTTTDDPKSSTAQ